MKIETKKMKKNIVKLDICLVLGMVYFLYISCKQSKDDGKETILKGKTTIS
jgi:hypothetical protein